LYIYIHNFREAMISNICMMFGEIIYYI
jgi:hypothetical protein